MIVCSADGRNGRRPTSRADQGGAPGGHQEPAATRQKSDQGELELSVDFMGILPTMGKSVSHPVHKSVIPAAKSVC